MGKFANFNEFYNGYKRTEQHAGKVGRTSVITLWSNNLCNSVKITDVSAVPYILQVNWQTVLWGIGLQFVFALVVLRWPAGYAAFKWLGDRVSELLAYGSEFVFGASYREHLFAFQVNNIINDSFYAEAMVMAVACINLLLLLC